VVVSTQETQAWQWAEREAERLGVTTDELLSAMRLRGWLIHQIERLDPAHIKRLQWQAAPDHEYAATIREICANSDRRWY